MRAIVVGGGAAGLAAADALAGRDGTRVVLLEREALPGSGATGRNPGAIRTGFDSALHTSLTMRSLALLEGLAERTRVDLGFERRGYLWLGSSEAHEAGLRGVVRQLVERGGTADWLDPDEIRRIVPALDAGRLRGAAFFSRDGYLDPHALATAFLRGAVQAGAEIRSGESVRSLAPAGATGKWRVVTDREALEADAVVVAAGAWSARLVEGLGVHLPLEPYRRHSFVTGPAAWYPADAPFVVDAETGAYFRPTAGSLMFGRGREYEEDAVSASLDVAAGALTRAHAAAAEVVPALRQATVRFGVAGPYQMTPDLHAIVGPVEALPGLHLACGFSGHGLMHAPITGQLIADWILQGEPASLPEARALVLARFARGETLAEQMQI